MRVRQAACNSVGMTAADLRALADKMRRKIPADEIAAWLAEADRLDNVVSGGRLVLLERFRAHGLYRCHCGKTRRIRLGNVARGIVKSCGCLAAQKLGGAKPKIATKKGERFGWWTVLGEAGARDRKRLVRAACKCGREFNVYAQALHRGQSMACKHCSKTEAFRIMRREAEAKQEEAQSTHELLDQAATRGKHRVARFQAMSALLAMSVVIEERPQRVGMGEKA